MTEEILGYPVTTLTRDEVVRLIADRLEKRKKRIFLACANPHSLEVARKDRLFEDALRGSDLLIPDGVGIVMASRLQGGRIARRVTGSDIFLGVSRRLNERKGARYFFLGSTEENLRALTEKLAAEFPRITVAGSYAPPFKDTFDEAEDRRIVSAINAAKPHVLWVGMTAPKQEKWIHGNLRRLDVGFAAAVGAVFDFYTGRVRRSHPLFQAVGLEWLPRLLRDPARLWRRNLVSNPAFLARSLAAAVKKRMK